MIQKRYVEKRGLYQNEYTIIEYAMNIEMKVSLDLKMNVSYLLQKQKDVSNIKKKRGNENEEKKRESH